MQPHLTRAPLRALAAAAAVLGLSGCILTTDIPDPALQVPAAYKDAGRASNAARPQIDWWRGFKSRELTSLMEEAQTFNLDIAAAVARIVQADAQARITGAALLPTLSAGDQASRSKSSGSSSSGLTNSGREITNFSSSLSASYEIDFWGKNRDAALAASENATASRFDRDVVALTTMAAVANAYFQVLAAQDRIRTANRNIASAERILEAIKQRLS
ncbi:MAG: TolC family protein, partial [Rhizobiales bacterium]|nr:TolC family protein [Hyphomicrobiales bacterium]